MIQAKCNVKRSGSQITSLANWLSTSCPITSLPIRQVGLRRDVLDPYTPHKLCSYHFIYFPLFFYRLSSKMRLRLRLSKPLSCCDVAYFRVTVQCTLPLHALEPGGAMFSMLRAWFDHLYLKIITVYLTPMNISHLAFPIKLQETEKLSSLNVWEDCRYFCCGHQQ